VIMHPQDALPLNDGMPFHGTHSEQALCGGQRHFV
jgi:hypothetical protein